MSTFKIALSIVICTVSLCLTLVQRPAEQPSQEQDAMPPRELVILYAKTKMDLAQVEFDWAKEQAANGVIAKPKLERQRSELAVSKELYNQAIIASSGGLEKIRLCNAEEKVRLAKSNYEKSKVLRARDSLSEFGLERSKLKYQLAKLNLTLLKNPENYVTLIEALQAQIDQLGQDTLSLDLRITKLESANF